MVNDDNSLWFASFNGLSIYDGHQYVEFTQDDGLTAKNLLTDLFKDSKR